MGKLMRAHLKAMVVIGVMSLALSQASCTRANTGDSRAQVTEQASPQFHVTHVDAVGAQALLKTKPDAIVLDIRTPKEVAKGHIEGAVFADFYADDFAEQLTRLDKETHYVVHCGSGGRSTKALSTLEELGFTNITHMDGGLRDWNKANLPLTQP